jgi:tetratricopeptide (TPR) repeat protein
MPHAEKAEKSGMDSVKKWIGFVAAILSLGSAVWALMHAQADKNARAAEATSLLAAGRLEEKAGDYEHAWDNFEKAGKIASKDGVLAKLVGGATQQQHEAHDALEELAELWVRESKASDEQGLGDIADHSIKVLSAEVDGATGVRKADMLAHIGYAYFLKERAANGGDGPISDKPAQFYQEAIAVDPQNPFANAFWGHLIIWTHGSVDDAKQHFAAALASGREHAVVRHFQIAGLSNGHSDAVEAAWWQALYDMQKAGEAIDANSQHDMESSYYFLAQHDDERKTQFAAVPPAEHEEMARALIKTGGGENGLVPLKVILAESLEAQGKKDEALTAWRDVAADINGDASDYSTAAKEAIKRLGGSQKPAGGGKKR